MIANRFLLLEHASTWPWPTTLGRVTGAGERGPQGIFPTASPTKFGRFGRVRRITKGGSPFAIGPVTFAWTTVAMDKSIFRSLDSPLRCACGFEAFGVLINSQPF